MKDCFYSFIHLFIFVLFQYDAVHSPVAPSHPSDIVIFCSGDKVLDVWKMLCNKSFAFHSRRWLFHSNLLFFLSNENNGGVVREKNMEL